MKLLIFNHFELKKWQLYRAYKLNKKHILRENSADTLYSMITYDERNIKLIKRLCIVVGSQKKKSTVRVFITQLPNYNFLILIKH